MDTIHTSEENFTCMVASIGSGKPQRPNRRLVGDAPRLPVRAIPKWGTVTLKWPQGVAQALHAKVTPAAGGVTIETAGGATVWVAIREWAMPSPRGRQRGIRRRFVCPRCEASRDALHWFGGEWGCRGKDCHNLAFASRHRERYCPAIRRRARLLRKLARVLPRGLRAQRLREQIAHQESLMLASVKRTNDDLKRRRQRHARIDNSQRAG